MREAARSVVTALRWGVVVKDRAFDRLYPLEVRRLSSVHWTPVRVALRAAAWLAPEPGIRVLDVGSGCGKVCCIGALARAGRWHGIERDPSLVKIATETAALLEIEHVATFQAGDMDAIDWHEFDSFYFYNPFASILFGPAPFEPSVRWPMLTDQIARTEAHLADAAVGTRVVTYEGFGGEMPDNYTRTHTEVTTDGQLVLWIKQPSKRRATGDTASGV